MTNYYFGIDVSKNTLDIVLLKDGSIISSHVIENTSRCIDNFFQPFSRQFQLAGDEAWVCMEHTGIYNYPLLKSLAKLRFKICVEPALQIKRSQGIARGKNDEIDALRIAQYAYKNRENLKIWQPQRLNLQKLKALLSQRERLSKVRVQLATPTRECAKFLDASISKALIATTKNSLIAIKKDLKKIEEEILKIVKTDEKLSQQFGRATSVVGIGPITALQLIVTSGEFELIKTPNKFACYAGVAPFEHKSGTSVRGRTRVSMLANANIKRLLHLAALSAIQCNDEIRDYYRRKVAEGKNKMSIINAVRNKLITRVFMCVNQNRDYQKNYSRSLV